MNRYRNLVLFFYLAAAWGVAFTAIKAGLDYFPPVLFAAIRYDVAGVVMIGYATWATGRWRPATRDEWVVVAVAGAFMIAAYHAFLFVGQQYVTSAVAAIVVGLNPVLTTGFARALLPGERLAPAGILGLLLGLAGVVVLARPDPANLLDSSGVGVVLVFAAVASFALGSVLTRRSSADPGIELQTAWSMLLGALAMHAVSAALGERVAAVEWTLPGIAALAFLSLVASALGFLVYFDLLDRLGPVEINLVSYVVPLFAALTGFVLLGEPVTIPTAVGFALIVAGFALVKRREIASEVQRVRGHPSGD